MVYLVRKWSAEQKAIYQKEYNELNKDKIIAKRKHKYEQNKDVVLARQKKYVEENKDKVLTRVKKYYENNKAMIKALQKIKVHCNECNCEVNKSNISFHNKTKKHLKNSAIAI